MSEIQYDPGSLRSSAQGLRDSGDQLRQAWQQLVSDVQGMGDPFGDDQVGGLIGASYNAIQDIANRTFGGAADNLHGFGTGLDSMATIHEGNEQATTGSLRQLRDQGA